MKKIKTLFERDMSKQPALVINKVTAGSEWVINGDGIATRKYDGCCCKIENLQFFKRREIKKGKPIPNGFILVEKDQITGKSFGWLPVDFSNPQDKYFVEAFNKLENKENGTYELLGKGSQGDAEKMGEPILLKHYAAEKLYDVPTDFEGLKNFLKDKDIEGIVWHHKIDNRMVKIKKKDFGFKRLNQNGT